MIDRTPLAEVVRANLAGAAPSTDLLASLDV